MARPVHPHPIPRPRGGTHTLSFPFDSRLFSSPGAQAHACSTRAYACKHAHHPQGREEEHDDDARAPYEEPQRGNAGGDSAGATPDPIPNSEVKPRRADGTAGATRWESTAPPATPLSSGLVRVALPPPRNTQPPQANPRSQPGAFLFEGSTTRKSRGRPVRPAPADLAD